MRAWSLLLLAACGPIYPQQQAQPNGQPAPVTAQNQNGPPGGGVEDPYANTNDPNGDPDPATRNPSDPYAGDPAVQPTPTAPNATDPWAPRDRPHRKPRPPRPQWDPRDVTPQPPDPPQPPAPPQPAVGPSPQPQGTPPRPPPPPPPTAGLSKDQQALLDAHNRVRANHCAAPLKWSPQLAAVAQNWANTLRDKGCSFGHSGGKYGENLAAGTTGSIDGKAVLDMWYEEIKDFNFSSGGFSMKTGHFTQVVWRGTSQIGCGMSQCNGNDIWVCNYDPPGNYEGEYRKNVLPANAKCPP